MNMPRCSAPWAVMVLLLSLILCSIRFTNQVRLRAAPDTLQFERMKEKQWERTHKLTDMHKDFKFGEMANIAVGDVNQIENENGNEPVLSKTAQDEIKILEKIKLGSKEDINQDGHTDKKDAREITNEQVNSISEGSRGAHAGRTNSFKFREISRMMHNNAEPATNSTNEAALDTIREHVSKAVKLQRTLMKMLQTNAKSTVQNIVTMRSTQDIGSELVNRLVKIMDSTIQMDPTTQKMHKQLKKTVQQAIQEIKMLNEDNYAAAKAQLLAEQAEANAGANGGAGGANGGMGAAGAGGGFGAGGAGGLGAGYGSGNMTSRIAMSAKEAFRRRNDLLTALEQNQEAITAFDELISARLKLANSLTAAHNVTKHTLRAMMAEANLTLLESRFNRIHLLGDHIKEAKVLSNDAVRSAIEERAEAEYATAKAGVEPLSDIRADLGLE